MGSERVCLLPPPSLTRVCGLHDVETYLELAYLANISDYLVRTMPMLPYQLMLWQTPQDHRPETLPYWLFAKFPHILFDVSYPPPGPAAFMPTLFFLPTSLLAGSGTFYDWS